MKRILTIVFLIVVFAALVTLPFIIWGADRFASFSDHEKAVTTFILASLELVGIVFSIVIVVYILYQYIRYRRPHRLVFEAFSNESELIDTEKKPLNLSMLAQEELVRRFKIIYTELKGYTDDASNDFEALVADELYIEEVPSGNEIGNYVSVDQIKKSGVIEDLMEVIRSLKDSKGINLIDLVGEIAPKEVTPVMKFIEAIFPPHIVRATGYLQWRSDIPGRVGITFEFVDLSNQRNLMVRTLWWQASENDTTTLQAEATVDNETLINKATDRYIELLSPAMHWLALMFWEQNLLSHVPLINRILKVRENRRQARIFYLLGALYYASSNRFQANNRFFCQLAVEHLRQASITDSSWNLPYLYLANLYCFKMLEAEGDIRKKLFKETQSLCKKALDHTKKSNMYTQHRIIIAKALAELYSGDDNCAMTAGKELEQLETELDPANYSPKRADCSAYLLNLSIWYITSYHEYKGIPNDWEKGRRYLAYWLARYRDQWDIVNNNFNDKSLSREIDLEPLEQELAKKLEENPELANWTGERFKTEIDLILEKVDRKKKMQ